MPLQLILFDDAKYSVFGTDQHRRDSNLKLIMDIQMVVLAVHSNFCSNQMQGAWLVANLNDHQLKSVKQNGWIFDIVKFTLEITSFSVLKNDLLAGKKMKNNH